MHISTPAHFCANQRNLREIGFFIPLIVQMIAEAGFVYCYSS
jgi:hypothetical protein